MYCGQCGKKVMENMLFCPFCGSPIVIPDQDEAAGSKAAAGQRENIENARPTEAQGERAGDRLPGADAAQAPVSLFSDAPAERPAPAEEFVPLRFSFEEEAGGDPEPEGEPELQPEAREEVRREAEQAPPLDVAADIIALAKRRSAPKRPENARNRSVNTYIPLKDMDPDDIFMDGGDEADDYDLEEDFSGAYGCDTEDFDYEEPESGNFFQRHIRGIVGLILFLILLVVCAAWAFSPKGQMVLAQANLAWSAEAYADLGYSAYQKDSALLAARYYEQALSRDPNNYEYAHSAMVAYYDADKIESAAAMLKKCVDLDPDNPEPYEEMLILYPDADARPWDISELIRMGYERTGAESLKVE